MRCPVVCYRILNDCLQVLEEWLLAGMLSRIGVETVVQVGSKCFSSSPDRSRNGDWRAHCGLHYFFHLLAAEVQHSPSKRIACLSTDVAGIAMAVRVRS